MPSDNAPSYQRYPDKWLAGTKRLTWPAKGIYADLLETIWLFFQDTCSIPDDAEFICAELHCTADEWKAARAEIMLEHKPLLVHTETNRLFSAGLYKERVKQCDRRLRLRENGKKGGRPRNQENQKGVFEKPKQKAGATRLPSPTPSPTPTPATPTGCLEQPTGGCEFDGAAEKLGLGDPRFLGVWHRWVLHNAAHPRKPLSVFQAEAQLAKMKPWGVEKAMRALDAALEAGGPRIFDPDERRNKLVERSAAYRDYQGQLSRLMRDERQDFITKAFDTLGREEAMELKTWAKKQGLI